LVFMYTLMRSVEKHVSPDVEALLEELRIIELEQSRFAEY
jgi:hypothetical protein